MTLRIVNWLIRVQLSNPINCGRFLSFCDRPSTTCANKCIDHRLLLNQWHMRYCLSTLIVSTHWQGNVILNSICWYRTEVIANQRLIKINCFVLTLIFSYWQCGVLVELLVNWGCPCKCSACTNRCEWHWKKIKTKLSLSNLIPSCQCAPMFLLKWKQINWLGSKPNVNIPQNVFIRVLSSKTQKLGRSQLSILSLLSITCGCSYELHNFSSLNGALWNWVIQHGICRSRSAIFIHFDELKKRILVK